MKSTTVKEITDKLEHGLTELFESERYADYLKTMSRFHNYSFNNSLLIALQKPDATLVAGYKAWQNNFGRTVKSGEKAIRILAPASVKKKETDNDTKEETEVKVTIFKQAFVFDISQTEGKDIPTLRAEELRFSIDNYADFMTAISSASPVPIAFSDIPSGAKGYFSLDEQCIVIQDNMAQAQTVKTLIHEISHSLLHDKDTMRIDCADPQKKNRSTKEVEAESVAYVVCQYFDIDTSDYSFGYIAGWSSGKDLKELKESMNTIQKTASFLITQISDALNQKKEVLACQT